MNKLYLLLCNFLLVSCATPEIIRTNKPKGYIISSESAPPVNVLPASVPVEPGFSFWGILFWSFWVLSVVALIWLRRKSVKN